MDPLTILAESPNSLLTGNGSAQRPQSLPNPYPWVDRDIENLPRNVRPSPQSISIARVLWGLKKANAKQKGGLLAKKGTIRNGTGYTRN
jgi:hypothetical protein